MGYKKLVAFCLYSSVYSIIWISFSLTPKSSLCSTSLYMMMSHWVKLTVNTALLLGTGMQHSCFAPVQFPALPPCPTDGWCRQHSRSAPDGDGAHQNITSPCYGWGPGATMTLGQTPFSHFMLLRLAFSCHLQMIIAKLGDHQQT